MKELFSNQLPEASNPEYLERQPESRVRTVEDIVSAFEARRDGLEVETYFEEHFSKKIKLGPALVALSLGLNTVAGQAEEVRSDKKQENIREELIEKTGYDLVSYCEQLGCDLRVEIESKTGQYILHIGQIHRVSDPKEMVEYKEQILLSQEKQYALLKLLGLHQQLGAYFEGFSGTGKETFALAQSVERWIRTVKKPVAGLSDSRLEALSKGFKEIGAESLLAEIEAYQNYGLVQHFENMGYSFEAYRSALSRGGKELTREKIQEEILLRGAHYALLFEVPHAISIRPGEKDDANAAVFMTMREAQKGENLILRALVQKYRVIYPEVEQLGSSRVLSEFREEFKKLLDIEDESELAAVTDLDVLAVMRDVLQKKQAFVGAVFEREVATVQLIYEQNKSAGKQLYPLVYGAGHDFGPAVQEYNQRASTQYGLISIRFNDQPISPKVADRFFLKKEE